MTERMWHKTIGGNADDAVKYGLTLKAECGLVWVPTVFSGRDEHPEIEDCPNCHPVQPTYVYRCFDASGALLYVGCTRAPKTRVQSHRAGSWWWPQVESVRFVVFPSREYALEREAAAIANETPLWNVRGQVYKTVPADEFQPWIERAVAVEAPQRLIDRLVKGANQAHGLSLAVNQ